MNIVSYRLEQLKSLIVTIRAFKNPLLIILARLGLISVPYFVYRFHSGNHSYAMLGRPATTSMADLFVIKEVFIHETYKGLLPYLPNNQLRIVDIGANLGSFTIWLNHKIGVREAYCFEPEPDSFAILRFNLSINRCIGYSTIQCAVGGLARTINISLKKSSPGGTTIYGDSETQGDIVDVVSFASWLGRIDGDFDILKMDCEGAEWEIFDQTKLEYFSRFQIFIAEIHHDPISNRPVDHFRIIAESKGFRTIHWDNRIQGIYMGIRSKTPTI